MHSLESTESKIHLLNPRSKDSFRLSPQKVLQVQK